MKNKQLMLVSMGAAALASVGMTGCSKAVAGQRVTQADGGRTVELTVYADDFGMVREGRDVPLNAGRTKIGVQNVSRLLDPQTVLYDWDGGGPQVVSTTYDLGVNGGDGLLKRYMGKKIEMLWPSDNGRPTDRIEGTLESADNGTIIRSGDKYYVNPAGTIVAPANGEIVTIPQLSAEVDAPSAKTAKLEVAYQTRGLSWQSDYTGKLDASGTKLELECWATVTNHTGVDFPDAKLTLMAGSPNRAVRAQLQSLAGVAGGAYAEAKAEKGRSRDYGIQPVAMGELYAYKVPARVSIGQEQMNRVRMLSATSVPVHRDYSVGLPAVGAWDSYGWGSNAERIGAQLALTFDNAEAGGLGMPLPSGAVRVYDPDAEGKMQFTGAATIGNTPKDAHVALSLSKVFDVYVQRKSAKDAPIDKKTVRRTIELVLHNEKKAEVPLRLVQPMYGSWKMASESHPSTKLNANTAQWLITVPAGGETVLRFSVDLKR